MTKILSGKEVAAALKEKLTAEVNELKKRGSTPALCIVMAGDRPDSESYIKGAVKRCTDIGIDCQVEKLPEEISQDEFLKVLDGINKDSKINGIIIMRPLPEQISEDVVKYKIAPEKDVDCFNPINVSKVMSGDSDGFAPCTPQAVI